MKEQSKSSMMSISTIVLFITTLSAALIAGLFYAYSCSVNLGLGKLSDQEYLLAMQSINREILNPVFFTTFMGTLLLLPVSAYVTYGQSRFIFLLAATVLYTAGVFGVTIFGNVPLNESLGAFDVKSASVDEIANQRLHFEQPWNRLHLIRTWASLICLGLVIVACLKTSSVDSE